MIRSLPALALLAVYAFMVWLILQPAIYVSPSLEAAAIRLIQEHTR